MKYLEYVTSWESICIETWLILRIAGKITVTCSREWSRLAQSGHRAWTLARTVGENIEILSKTWISVTTWHSAGRHLVGVLFIWSLKSNLCITLKKRNAVGDNCIISHVCKRLHFSPMYYNSNTSVTVHKQRRSAFICAFNFQGQMKTPQSVSVVRTRTFCRRTSILHDYIHEFRRIFIEIHTCIRSHVCARIIHMHTNIRTHIHAYLHRPTYIYIYIYIYI